MPVEATLIDVDADGDGGVVAWLDDTTFKVSTQKSGQKVIFNEDSSYMFCGYYDGGNEKTTTEKLESIDLKNVDTSNVTDMSYIFSLAGQYATSFNLDLSGWDTSNVTNMQNMFSNAGYYATSWSIGDISDWDTSKVTNMSNMFDNAGRNATYSLNLSGWNVNKIDSHNNFNFDGETKVTAPAWAN